MTRRFGIDTSVLVRLLTRHPEAEFGRRVSRFHELVDEGDEVFASNRIICETYVAVQHHYGESLANARASLRDALRSGLVAPLNGRSVIAALEATGGSGLFDRLIADGDTPEGLEVLAPDK